MFSIFLNVLLQVEHLEGSFLELSIHLFSIKKKPKTFPLRHIWKYYSMQLNSYKIFEEHSNKFQKFIYQK